VSSTNRGSKRIDELGTYSVLYIDPPWSYKNKKTGGSMVSGSASKYPTLSLYEIKNLPIQAICEKNCVLFLWATVPLLPDALEVMKAWGFKYKTTIFWRKIMSLGMGFWFRGQVEILLFGIKGKVKAFRLQEANFIQCKSEKHSKKPEIFRELIERAVHQTMENPRFIELFATKRTEGWECWGKEIP